jgi:cobalt-zinc-cadmium resistance protein CzcA
MLESLVQGSIRHRHAAVGALLVLPACGVQAARTLPMDAIPDVSSTQVAVLTGGAGLGPVEMEQMVTIPVENALNGVPHALELRSTSRAGLSAVVVVFDDKVDPWFARQLVAERLRGLESDLPPGVGSPSLGPLSTGLGEIYQFVLRSEHHTPMQLRTLLDWTLVPRLRSVPGIIEVNTQGGDLKQYQVVVDRERLRSHGLGLQDVVDALRGANLNVGGGYLDRGPESLMVRGEGVLHDEADVGRVVIRRHSDGPAVLVSHVAEVKVGRALPYGVITSNGEGEAVTGQTLMILGGNSKVVVEAVRAKVEELRRDLPPGVQLESVYDRSDFVGATIGTVMANLAEGVGIVLLVLVLFLGTLRGALAVVLGIPASMAVALLGMHALGVTGDLMSLGAIDFGFLVDGPIVMLEAIITGTAGRVLVGRERLRTYALVSGQAARPVAFAVAIIMLVYLPLLTLEGVEGRMFRPMALTMACALAGAVIYAVLFFPAVLALLVPPKKDHGPAWLEALAHAYAHVVGPLMKARWAMVVLASVVLVVSAAAFASQGAEFVPRIFEGDAMVTIRRAPSISLDEARRLDLEAEKVLHTFPEVATTLGMTGRAEVATDPVGADNTDIMVRLRPPSTWTSAASFDDLCETFKNAIEARVPGTFVSVSQPIEDKVNELISGSRADVAVQLYGSDLTELADLADRVGKRLRQVRGAGDVRIERILGQPSINVVANRAAMARHGVRVEDAFSAVQASREGVDVGNLYEGSRRFGLRVVQPPQAPTAESLSELFVQTQDGTTVPLSEVVTIQETDGPTAIRRLNRERVVRIDINLRGRDLLSFVAEARATVDREFPVPPGWRVEWGGQFENFERAQRRLQFVVPAVILIILGMLMAMFRSVRFALPVFLMVPFSLAGGMAGLTARGLPFSLPAAVGFIALGGIAVLNGVVMATEVRRRLQAGMEAWEACRSGSAEVVRAVITTAAVAALGFWPMAVSDSAGAEVQRPLATVVIAGIVWGTLLTLTVLPGLMLAFVRGYVPSAARQDDLEAPPVTAPPLTAAMVSPASPPA